MVRKLLLGLVVGLLAIGAFFAVAKADIQTNEGITPDYKADLLAAVDDLVDLTHDLLKDTRTKVFDSLWVIKDKKVEAFATLNAALKYDLLQTSLVKTAQDLIQSAEDEKRQTTFKGLRTVTDTLLDLEGAIAALYQDIEENILAGNIAQVTADQLIKATTEDGRPLAPLLVISYLLFQKNNDLVEIDKLLEQANEYESEALAWLNTVYDKDKKTTGICGTNTDCQKKAVKEAMNALKDSIQTIRKAEKIIWAIKDNIQSIKAWLCGFKQLVMRAPILQAGVPGPSCPWCLPPPPPGGLATTELRTYSENGTIRFAALGGAVQGMRVQVFNLSGKTVFDSGLVAGNMLAWRTHDVANGVYLYTIEVKTAAGVTRSEVRKLAVLK
jgi:hypothetical protein